MNIQFILINSIYSKCLYLCQLGGCARRSIHMACMCAFGFCKSGMSNKKCIFDCLRNIDRYRWIGLDWIAEKKEILLEEEKLLPLFLLCTTKIVTICEKSNESSLTYVIWKWEWHFVIVKRSIEYGGSQPTRHYSMPHSLCLRWATLCSQEIRHIFNVNMREWTSQRTHSPAQSLTHDGTISYRSIS